jgi:hypothetical protein
MAIDFPANPTNGQQYQNFYYDSSITAWRNLGSKNALSSAVTALQTANATTNQAGLVPVVPASVAVNSGSASFSTTTGLVTFSGAGTLSLNSCFTSAYTNYRIILRASTSVPTGITLQLKVSGTASTTAYYWGGYIGYVSGSGSSAYNSAGSSSGQLVGFAGSGTAGNLVTSSVVDVFSPAVATQTAFSTMFQGADAGNSFALTSSGIHNAATAYDGLQLNLSNGTFSGTLQVYGYR